MTPGFSSDSPIARRDQDFLGRRRFAERIAEALASHRPAQSDSGISEGAFVVALCGDWGSGKTSVKNMVVETLGELSSEQQPRVVEFNPWEWSNSNQLTGEFFEALAENLGQANQYQKTQRLISLLRRYSSRLRLHGVVGDGSQQILKWISGAAGLTAILGVVVPEGLKSYLLFLALCFGGMFSLCQWGSEALDKWAAALETQAKPSLSSLKKALSDELSQLPVPLLVVMDDIDRLSAEEIPHLFQLVKANANFPNVVYLLLFDRAIVERALERVAPKLPRNAGREYLEKIVQVAFDLPTVSEGKIGQFVCDELTRIVAIAPRASMDERRWRELWREGLQPFFASLRDARRFLNSFDFHLRLFVREGELEVEPSDIVAIEVLRVFEPDVYSLLPSLKEVLTRDFDRVGRMAGGYESQTLERERESRIQALNALIQRAHPDKRVAVRSMLPLLFPAVAGLLREENQWPRASMPSIREARVSYRVCLPVCFDRYFQLALNENEISRAEIERILAMADNQSALTEVLVRHREDETLPNLLSTLGIYSDRFSTTNAVPLVSALLTTCDGLPYKPISPSLPMLGLEMSVYGLMCDALERLPERAERSQQLKAAIQSSTAFYLPAYSVGRAIRLLEELKEKQSPNFEIERECSVVEADIPELRRLCVEKIQAAAEDGRLAIHRELALLLHTWRLWRGTEEEVGAADREAPEEIKDWVRRLIETDEGILNLLRGFLRPSSGGPAEEMEEWRTLWAISLSSLDYFVSEPQVLEALERLGRQSSNTAMDEVRSRTISAYRLAVQRRSEGKSESDFWGVP